MLNELKDILVLIALLIALGLVLRFGNSSLALAKTANAGLLQETQALQLTSGNAPYYGPPSTATGGPA